MPSRKVLFLSICGLVVFLLGAGKYQPFEGSQKDSHGDIRWKSAVSQVEQDPPSWLYRHEVWNNDSLNCWIVWKAVDFDSPIPPQDSIYSESAVPSRPLEAKGDLRFAGGSSSGEGVVSDVRAWVPEGGKVTISSKAKIFLDLDGKLSPVVLIANSTLSKDEGGYSKLAYLFEISGVPSGRLRSDLKATWNPTGSKEPHTGAPNMGDSLPLDENGRFQTSIRLSGDVEVARGAVTLSNRDGKVLARASAPALVPAEPIWTSTSPSVTIVHFGEPHRNLNRFVGTWSTSLKIWPTPDRPPMETMGSMEAVWVIGGQYVESVYKLTTMGQTVEGHQLDGYDSSVNKYVSTWIDNTGTGILFSTGTCSDDCTVFATTGETLDPATGQMLTSEQMTTFYNSDIFKTETFIKKSSGEFRKVAELTAQRRKSGWKPL